MCYFQLVFNKKNCTKWHYQPHVYYFLRTNTSFYSITMKKKWNCYLGHFRKQIYIVIKSHSLPLYGIHFSSYINTGTKEQSRRESTILALKVMGEDTNPLCSILHHLSRYSAKYCWEAKNPLLNLLSTYYVSGLDSTSLKSRFYYPHFLN